MTKEQLKGLMSFINHEMISGITSYIDRDKNNDKIHQGCLQLEEQGLIKRHLDNGKYIVWKPLERIKLGKPMIHTSPDC